MFVALKRFKFLSRFQLKCIAMFCMLLDHFAVAFLQPDTSAYFIMRYVFGRTSFPILCVLFVEGFFYTKRPWIHLRDYFLFALLSELPYDIVNVKSFQFPFVTFSGQNIMFTWLLGFLLCLSLQKLCAFRKEDEQMSLLSVVLVHIGFFWCFCAVAMWLRVDYLFVGIACIYVVFLLYQLYRDNIPFWILGLCVAVIDGVCSGTIWTFPAVLMFFFYDNHADKKQKRWKYCFYFFYPLHLFLFAFVLLYRHYF